MPFFTVHAALKDDKEKAASWGFRDRTLAERKFNEVCGPLCAEVWLLRWTDNRFVPRKKEVRLERHWTFNTGVEINQKVLGQVLLSGDFEGQSNFGSLIPNVVVKPDGTNDDLLGQILGLSVYDVHHEEAEMDEIDIAFNDALQVPIDDSNIHVLVDPDRIAIREWGGTFDAAFGKAFANRPVSMPDFDSPFQNLVLTCQWGRANDPDLEPNTYAWRARYRDFEVADFKRAQAMAEMLGKIDEIERTLSSPPKSFGEYVSMIARRLGLNPASIGCIVAHDASEERAQKPVLLDSTQLKVEIDDLILHFMRTDIRPGSRRVFVVSDASFMVEDLPKVLVGHGCAARGALSIKDGSWEYDGVLHKAIKFHPDVLLLMFLNDLPYPKIDGLDLSERLIRTCSLKKVIVTRLGERVTVRDEVLDYLNMGVWGCPFDIVDVPFEIDHLLSLIDSNA